MHSTLIDSLRDTPEGREAADILRKCVHCGFCNATCPTYQLLGDELDGPRGRIYLIKQIVEGRPVTEKTRLHLDRCLTCLSCETTCPSGVEYHRLLAIGRHLTEKQVPRRGGEALLRFALREVLPRPRLFAALAGIGRALRPVLPSLLADKLPPEVPGRSAPWPDGNASARRMILLAGCVQPALAPNINTATARVLGRLGIAALQVSKAACCGALRHHLNDHDGTLDDARRNIDAWWPEIEAGIEAIIVTASGCGVQVREYGHLLRGDPEYAGKAARVAALTRDPAEVLVAEGARLLPLLEARQRKRGRLAFHSSCTLQHGLKVRGVVESLLLAAGFELVNVADAHLCCGSAGTYSVLQAELSRQLRDRKLTALTAGRPLQIATANIGCLTHLQAGCDLPVMHWIELIDEILK